MTAEVSIGAQRPTGIRQSLNPGMVFILIAGLVSVVINLVPAMFRGPQIACGSRRPSFRGQVMALAG